MFFDGAVQTDLELDTILLWPPRHLTNCAFVINPEVDSLYVDRLSVFLLLIRFPQFLSLSVYLSVAFNGLSFMSLDTIIVLFSTNAFLI